MGRPHSVCVNRNGVRFVDEACSYDEFGVAMVADQQKTGANTPCWLVVDATFRANSLDALAHKIQVPVAALKQTVANINNYAKSGVDPEFGRDGNAYDRMFGDPAVIPNPCLGAIESAPFYAVAINLGDLGTKGGLKVNDIVARAGRPREAT